MSVEHPVRGYTKIDKYAGHCDAPSCHMQARWKVSFEGRSSLFLCPRHKNEVLERERGAEG